jgi:hypothetical protein
VAREKADVLPPVLHRSDQTVEEQKRSPTSRALIVNLRSVYERESLFDSGKFIDHNSRCLTEGQNRSRLGVSPSVRFLFAMLQEY